MGPTKPVDAEEISVAQTSSKQSTSHGISVAMPDGHQTTSQEPETSAQQGTTEPQKLPQPPYQHMYATPSQPPLPYTVAPMDHSMPACLCPVHPYPPQLHQPYPQHFPSIAPSALVYPMSHALHDSASPAYLHAQAYGSSPQLQYVPYYGEAGSRLVAPYRPELPGMGPGDAYVRSPVHSLTSHSTGRVASPPSYAAEGFQAQDRISPVTNSRASNKASVKSHSSAHSNESYSRSESPVSKGAIKAVKAISKNSLRKSKYSGYALWVGNLPSRASIVALKDYFSQEFTAEIDSLFLISKSNCAFVNYLTEAGCTRAIEKFHNSRFQGAQLVCRLRKGSNSGFSSSIKLPSINGAVSSPTPSSSQGHSPIEEDEEAVEENDDALKAFEPANSENENEANPSEDLQAPERYFVMKSLTIQDMVQSVRTGLWATQRHNGETLNQAYKSADTVYLIFSVNRSREYFGYARMVSVIPDGEPDPKDANSRTSTADVAETRVTMTPATEYAPKGRIVEDLFRGTILWEVERDGDEKPAEAGEDEQQAWGKPFKVEWISTRRIPFYRARGLRNRWNANKEVKVARDGTEIEPEVGNTLLQLFHRTDGVQPHGTSATPYPLIVRDHPHAFNRESSAWVSSSINPTRC